MNYTSESSDRTKTRNSKKEHWFNRSVFGMGLTSFFSDASHEMATSVLPGFLNQSLPIYQEQGRQRLYCK